MQPGNTIKSKDRETNPRFFPRNQPDIHPVNGLVSQSSKIPNPKREKQTAKPSQNNSRYAVGYRDHP
jgi:hypothetical protein